MLSALPVIPPVTPDLLRTHHPRAARGDSPPPRSGNGGDAQTPHNRPNANNALKKAHPNQPPTPHALLVADEATIQHRKAAIRNFGASWIRPPGVAKTLQAMREEEAEMLEQEEMSRQEQGLRDLRARQEVEEARERAAEGAMEEDGVGGVDGERERDLDDEIPDADVDEHVDGMGGEGDVTFNEDSIMVEGSHLIHHHDIDHNGVIMQEEAELTGAARDEEELGIEHERDLDDSVPEAGSYQHTDTEVEDTSSSSDEEDRDEQGASELHDSFAAQSSRRARGLQQRQQIDGSGASAGMQGSLQERLRAQTATGGSASGVGDGEALTRSPGSLNLSSSLLESSFVGSSPVMQRGRGGGSGVGRRRGRLS